MKVFERIGDFVDNQEIELHYIENKIYIVNYVEISDFNNKNIILKHKNGTLKINGNNLVITKLLNNELLICGEIINIDFR